MVDNNFQFSNFTLDDQMNSRMVSDYNATIGPNLQLTFSLTQLSSSAEARCGNMLVDVCVTFLLTDINSRNPRKIQ